jgi:hypothetical protein
MMLSIFKVIVVESASHFKETAPEMYTTRIGLGIAKSVLEVPKVDANEQVTLQRRLRRGQAVQCFANPPQIDWPMVNGNLSSTLRHSTNRFTDLNLRNLTYAVLEPASPALQMPLSTMPV